VNPAVSTFSAPRVRIIGTIILTTLILFQAASHLLWLSISAHSGQVAIPYMMNRGMALFGTLWEQHAPAASTIAAIAQRLLPFIAPVDVARLLNLLVVAAITVLVYRLAARLAGDRPAAGIAAALFWVWWEPVYGNILFYFDTLLGLCACVAVLIWVEQGRRRPIAAAACAGLCMGLATLAKQHGWAAAVLFGAFILIYARRAFAAYVIGALTFPLIAIGWVSISGNLERYLYWNWGFNFSGLMDSDPLTGDFLRKLALSNLFVLPFALLLVRSTAPRRGLLLLLIWAGAALTLLPRFGIIHAMAHLPFAAVMAGVVVSSLIPKGLTPFAGWIAAMRALRPTDGALIGILAVVGIATLWTGAVVYVPNTLGRAAVPGYDEFAPLVARMAERQSADDTLFILPETDSTPQIHMMTGLLPPGLWVKGWRWYLEAPGVSASVFDAWAIDPPDWIIVFPDLVVVGAPAITPFTAWVSARYRVVDTVPDVVFHGDAVIYQRIPPAPSA